MSKLIIYIGIFFILANCSNKITYSGKIINNDTLQNINFENKNKLISKLGYPSYIDPIENKFFYYSEVSEKKSSYIRSGANGLAPINRSPMPLLKQFTIGVASV